MLFRKGISTITHDDVVTFCTQNIRENEILEYKLDFPANLEKVISSMANTYGGLVIIGIGENDGFPKPPFEGINYVSGLQERAIQIDISNIFPPVLPEIQVCPQVNSKTFVIIRIPESNSTPHYIMKKTKAYVRTGNVTTPERIADVNELEWLRNRRARAESFREDLFLRTNQHFKNICSIKEISLGQFPETTISICPLFPSRSLVPVQELQDILIKNKTKPRITYNQLREYKVHPIENGLVAYLMRTDYNILDFLEINQFGLICKTRNLEWKATIADKFTNINKKISYEEIFSSILAFLEFANSFYKRIGYKGLCRLKYSVKGTLGIALDPYIGGAGVLSWGGISLVDEIELSKEYEICSIPALTDKPYRLDYLINIAKDIAWSFGSEFAPQSDEILIDYAERSSS